MVGTVERQTELAGGMKWVGGKVIGEAVKTRPGGEGRIRAPWTHDIESKFDMGQRSSGNSGWVEAKVEMRWFLLVLTDFSAGLDLCICGGTNCPGNRCERKYSLHSNEVSLSQMRLGRDREWAVKKARIEEKERT